MEINRFSDNINVIQNNLESFCNELKAPYSDNVEIEAIFVSMDTLEDEDDIKKSTESHPLPLFFRRPHVKIPDNVELWDFDKLLSRLRKVHVPREYLELLKRTRVAAIIDPFPLRTPTPGIPTSNNRSTSRAGWV